MTLVISSIGSDKMVSFNYMIEKATIINTHDFKRKSDNDD